MTEEHRLNRAEIVALVRKARAELDQVLQSHSEAELTEPGHDGWSVKDHLAHLAAWEDGLVGLLQGRGQYESMGADIGAAVRAGSTVDEINAILYHRNAGRTLQDVVAELDAVENRLFDELKLLSDDDLYKPYNSFDTADDSNRNDPVIGWIDGDSFGHYEEHMDWIKELLDRKA